MSGGKLPEGWEAVNLGSLINLSTGKLDANAADNDGQYPFFTCAESISQIKSWAFDTSAVLLAGNGSFSIKKYTGKFNAYQRTYVIEPLLIKTEFLYWLIRGNIRKITENGRGSTIPYIRKGDITDIIVALPSLSEQTLIADKLDTLLAQVDNTKARLEQIPQILKRFRQAVLAAAISGKLTEEWRDSPNLSGWQQGKLGDFVKKPSYGTSSKSSKEGLVPVLRMGNLQGGKLDWTDLVYTSDIAEVKKYKLEHKDVLFNRTNSPELVGKTAIYNSEQPAIYAGYLIRIQCLPTLDPDYLNYHLNSLIAKQYCYSVKSDGVSQSNINAKKLIAYPLHVPPLPEQQEIVRRVEQLFAYADTIEKQVNSALSRVNNLTQSILAKAFRGELTAQWRAENPELISGENSAAALLKNIKDEREAIKTLPKPKRSAIKKKTGKRMSKQIIKVVEALTQAGEPLSGQQLLAAAGYPSDSNTDDLEKFFLDIRQALIVEKSIVKLERTEDGQDWFSLAEVGSNE